MGQLVRSIPDQEAQLPCDSIVVLSYDNIGYGKGGSNCGYVQATQIIYLLICMARFKHLLSPSRENNEPSDEFSESGYADNEDYEALAMSVFMVIEQALVLRSSYPVNGDCAQVELTCDIAPDVEVPTTALPFAFRCSDTVEVSIGNNDDAEEQLKRMNVAFCGGNTTPGPDAVYHSEHYENVTMGNLILDDLNKKNVQQAIANMGIVQFRRRQRDLEQLIEEEQDTTKKAELEDVYAFVTHIGVILCSDGASMYGLSTLRSEKSSYLPQHVAEDFLHLVRLCTGPFHLAKEPTHDYACVLIRILLEPPQTTSAPSLDASEECRH
jgi:hypothetical protein